LKPGAPITSATRSENGGAVEPGRIEPGGSPRGNLTRAATSCALALVSSATVRTGTLSAVPVATHAGDDHGAARTKFLHVVCVANAHRVRPRIVAGIDVIGLGIREDSNSGSGTSLRRQIRRGRRRERRPGRPSQPAPRRRGVRLRRQWQQHCAAQTCKKCRQCHPDHHVHPKLSSDATVTVFASRVNSMQATIISNRRRRGTRARVSRCGRA